MFPSAPSRPVTVMVVDDEVLVLSTIGRALERYGFRVLKANSAETALEIAARTKERIDIAVCDVLMPGLNGPDLADLMPAIHPETRFLFVAGYAAHPIVSSRVVDRGLPFLEKPFLPETLAAKVRSVLLVAVVAMV